MQLKLNCTTIVVGIILCISILRVTADISSLSCSSCGEECTDACGTRHFRTCCFNYLRKRSGGATLSDTGEVNTKLPSSPINKLQRQAINSQQFEKLLYLLTVLRQNHGDISDELQDYFKSFDRPSSKLISGYEH